LIGSGAAGTFRLQGTALRLQADRALGSPGSRKSRGANQGDESMIIFGTALLAVCHLLGIFIGDLLGQALGVKTNVGGVGIAMLLLIFARIYMQKKDMMPKLTELGVEYWGAMYIPVVVAMAAQQDMVSALRGGPVALLSALAAVGICAVAIALINRMERPVAETAEPVSMLHDNPLLADAE
jgi:malonate transporter MadL subunit